VETSLFQQRKAERRSRLRPPYDTSTGNLGANPANSCPLTPLGFLERAATVFGDCPSVVYHDTVVGKSEKSEGIPKHKSKHCCIRVAKGRQRISKSLYSPQK
jgi:hypothetical protein